MAAYSNFSDHELIELLKTGDHSAYNEIYHRYFYLLYTHAYKKLRDEEQAKDVVQDLFATLWFKREFDLPNSNLPGYFFTVIRNKIFDLFAHEQVRTKHLDSLKAYLSRSASAPTDHLIREKELNVYIEKAIQGLPGKMRVIFEMSRKEELSYKEIAGRMKISENAVSKQVNNALRLLKTKLGIVVILLLLHTF